MALDLQRRGGGIPGDSHLRRLGWPRAVQLGLSPFLLSPALGTGTEREAAGLLFKGMFSFPKAAVCQKVDMQSMLWGLEGSRLFSPTWNS